MTPEQIGRYKIIAKIGQGAMGEVYRAHDSVLNREVAVKTITAGRGEDETLRKRFQREAQSAAQLSHPNIVKVFEFGEENEQLFMAMELLEGTELKQAIIQGDLGLARKLDILEKVCEGLAFAHAANIVHRDLKPANIHLGKDGSVKIMDFGLARMGGSDMTRTGMVMGTPHYMSPEQVKGGKADSRSDVFSLGALAYELLTGHKPFEAETMHAVLYKVMQEEPPPARDLIPTLPPVIAQVVERALAKEPTERFADAGQVLAALQRARQAVAAGRGDRSIIDVGRAGVVRPAERSHPSVRSGERSRPGASRSASQSRAGAAGWLPWAVAAIGVVIVAGVGLFVLRGGGGAPAKSGGAGAASGAVQDLASAVVETQVELARRKLEDGEYAEAAQRAERALRLDASNAHAKEILGRANEILASIEKAATEVRAAAGSGDAGRQANALWALMQLDPANALVTEMAPGLGSGFRPRAEEARRQMAASQKKAEDGRAGRLPEFQDGKSLGQQGETAFRAQQYGTAAQRFLEARNRFDRALAR